ncbi:hypothetical protein [Aureimonas sp. AU20]|uniref:hypothetical protein n=1 Tax=Aureimonas sp. AU20 TaxID=1349819 RepID=UPI00072308C6|nr:hypothetical protein [Aureimonas sp. AU20]ALN73191.1 hypothetical protein M673_10700 [Aureimonas sp. AU20]
MGEKRSTISISRYANLIAAAKAAGLPVVRSEIDADGRIVLVHAEPSDATRMAGSNSFDRILR